MNRNKELARNTVIFGIGTFGAKLMQFILVPLYSVYMSTTDYSAADLITSTVSLMTPFLTLGMIHGVVKFILTKHENSTTILRFSTLITFASTLLLYALLPVFRAVNVYGGRENLIPLLFLFGSLKSIYAAYCKAIEKNVVYAIDGIISAATTALLSWVFLGPLDMGIDGYIYAIMISYVISVIIFLCTCSIIKTMLVGDAQNGLIKSVMRYTVPLMPNDLSWWIIQMSDRYILRFIAGAVINGIYTMAYKIPGIFNMIVSVFISAFTITAFKECEIDTETGKYNGEYFGKIYEKYLAVTFICAVFVILATQPIALLLIKKDFYESWKYTPFLMIAFAIGNLESFMGTLLSGMNKTKYCFYSTTVGAIVNIILDIVFIRLIGVYGAIAATIIGYFVVYMVRIYAVAKYMDISLLVKKSVISLLLLLVLALCYTQASIVIRFISLFAVGMVFVLYRKEFVEMVSFGMNKIKSLLNR